MINTAYSKIQHLADALFFHHDPRTRYFTMLTSYTGYFDTSGSRSGGQFLVSAGLVASVDQWNNFDEHWKVILENAGISEFHMTDFISGKGEFNDEKWKKNDGFADNFLKKLVYAICKQSKKRTPIYAPMITIYIDDYIQLNKEYELEKFGMTPLALAAGTCIGMAYVWCEDRQIPFDHLECFHEDGDLDKGNLKKMIYDWFGIDLLLKKKQLRPLQACDLLAWEAAYPSKQQYKHGEPPESLRPSILTILKSIDCDPKKYTMDGWRAICENHKIQKR